MTGMHRGRRGLRWRLVVAVMAAAVGRGYLGRHRLADAALGLPADRAPAVVLPDAPALGRTVIELPDVELPLHGPELPVLGPEPLPVLGPQRAPVTVLTSPALPAAPLVVGGARLAVVPVPASPDPLVDTMPHPVVKLFPMPTVDHEGQVFAAEDERRAAHATQELADGAAGPAKHGRRYHGRHTA